MPAQQESWIATAYLSGATGPIAAGTVLCLNAAGDRYIPSTSANRAAAAKRSACIAITGGDDSNIAVEGQYVGVVPPNISGLAAGSESLVRVSTAGLLERVGSYSTSDDVCGHCDADGTAYVCFPLVGLGAALGASSAPGLPARSIQYYLNSSTLGGAAHASISTDGRSEHGADRTGGAATTGDDRYAANGTCYVRGADASDRCVWSHSTLASAGIAITQVLDVGRDRNTSGARVDSLNLYAQYATAMAAAQGTGSPSAVMGLFGSGFLTGTPSDPAFGYVQPNFALLPLSFARSTSGDIYNGGLGYLWVEDVTNVRSGALRTTGFGLWSRVSDHHPMVTIGSTDHDLLSASAAGSAGDIQVHAAVGTGLDVVGFWRGADNTGKLRATYWDADGTTLRGHLEVSGGAAFPGELFPSTGLFRFSSALLPITDWPIATVWSTALGADRTFISFVSGGPLFGDRNGDLPTQIYGKSISLVSGTSISIAAFGGNISVTTPIFFGDKASITKLSGYDTLTAATSGLRLASSGISLSGGSHTLTSAEAATPRVNVTGTGGTIVAPNLQDVTFQINASGSSGAVVVNTGSGGATIPAGKCGTVFHDGTNYRLAGATS